MSRKEKYISRNNYEIWFLDHLEGRLLPEDELMLSDFLAANPDLRAELDEFSDPIPEMTAPIVMFPGKAQLRKAPEGFGNMPQADYLMIKKTEEGLNGTEQAELNQILAEQPRAVADLSLYEKLRLTPPAIYYAQKKSLIRNSYAWFWPMMKGAVAAMLVISLLNYKDQFIATETESNLIAVTTLTPAETEVPSIISGHTETPDVETSTQPIQTSTVVKPTLAHSASAPETVSRHNEMAFINATPSPVDISIPARRMPNSYEVGLKMMLPVYLENQRTLAALTALPKPVLPDEPTTLIARASELIGRLSPLNLSVNRVYDADGELVAINVSGDNFEITQRLPRKNTLND